MITELNNMPEIEDWTAITSPIFSSGSGNNIIDPETGEELFNATDLYMAGANYLDMLDIKLKQGRGFNANSDSLKEMMVSPDFAQKLKNEKGWTDVTGHKIQITEHSQTSNDLFTIVGIYNNFHTNTALDENDRPTMMFYSDPYGNYINYFLLKFHDLTADNMQAVQQRLQRLYPDETIIVDSYARQLNTYYDDVKHFRSAVMTAGICALFIALMGLIGYVNDEMMRRSKEIAIRKVNGATTINVLGTMLDNVLLMAIPSAIIGGILAKTAADKWLEDFSVKADMSLWLFVAGLVAVVAVIAVTVTVNAYRMASSNPVKYLKNE